MTKKTMFYNFDKSCPSPSAWKVEFEACSKRSQPGKDPASTAGDECIGVTFPVLETVDLAIVGGAESKHYSGEANSNVALIFPIKN
jgi:hypothetical protein